MAGHILLDFRSLACVFGIVVISLGGQQHMCVGGSRALPLSSIEKHARAIACKGVAGDQGGADDTAMMQLNVAGVARRKRQEDQGSASCSDLHYSSSVFVTDVEIGTPPQKLELIADTGSNALVTPSCKCVLMGYCRGTHVCFNSSLSLSYKPHFDRAMGSYGPSLATLSYGSGSLVVEEASDVVQVANVGTYMKDAVFLTEDQRQMRMSGTFEGLLGLGLPGSSSYPLWAQVAGLSRYSLCFNNGIPGALVLNGASLKNPMTNLGKVHWGLDFQGMSVGDSSTPVLFCNPATKSPNMETVCGGIPDSGTTFVMGPQQDILTLFRSLCHNWPRCNNHVSSVDKAFIFHHLLYTCGDWLTPRLGIYEMPSIFLNLAGKDGSTQTFSLSPWAYVVETEREQFARVTAKLFPDVIIEATFPTGNTSKTCQAAFGASDMTTVLNGPIWILGTPLFYEHTVSYDIGSKPYQIGLTEGPCMSCNSSGTVLISSEATVRADQARAKGVPRKVKGPHREPNLHITAHM